MLRTEPVVAGLPRDRDGGRPLVLVGLSGSTASLRAASFAVGWASRQGASALFLHVVDRIPLPVFGSDGMHVLVDQDPQLLDPDLVMSPRRRAELTARIEEVVGDRRPEVPDWILVTALGPLRATFLEIAAAQGADLIVVGARSRRLRLDRGLADGLLSARVAPVVVVP